LPWALDELDLREWLGRHGATEAQADFPFVRAFYDLAFAFPEGSGGRGSIAAGAALRSLLQMTVGYRGAPLWRMSAGMGDTAFGPLYDVLTARGVRFEFFRRVEHLHVEGDRVAAVDVAVQARARRYDPLYAVGDVRAWPDRPLAGQLSEVAPGDLEADDGPALDRVTLRRGADFDDVVLAIPSTVHGRFARELMDASPRYRAMVEHTTAVPTIAAQVWTERSPRELGWTGTAPIVTGLPGLMRTYADMTDVAAAERWAEPPGSVAYFCGVAPPELFDVTDRDEAGRLVAARMRDWARRELVRCWPRARAGRDGFDDAALRATPAADAWAEQYARANVAPGDSGFANLYLAGDWTTNIVDGGSVEGAVASGIEAAEALLKR
jgi:uncharacterized protein with NAD-binding domain and iron-sulfur cluster